MSPSRNRKTEKETAENIQATGVGGGKKSWGEHRTGTGLKFLFFGKTRFFEDVQKRIETGAGRTDQCIFFSEAVGVRKWQR